MNQIESRTHRSRLTAAVLAPVLCLMIGGVAVAQTAAPAADPTAPPAAAPKDGAKKDWKGEGHGRHHGHHHGFMGARPDANGNVARTEVIAAQQRALAMFDKADTNQDGVLSRDEREAARKAMKAEHEKKREKQPGAQSEAPIQAPDKS